MCTFSLVRSIAQLLAITIFFSSSVLAAGLLSPVNSTLSALEIKQHHVNVMIEDGYAITQIEQIFHNPNGTDLEAIYSFPIPEKAAVGEFTYWIDGQAITGEVLAKAKAREVYQQQKQAGNDVAITEQDGYKTFNTLVNPVRANQHARIQLTYIQPVHTDTSIGRYVYPLEEGGVDTEKLNFWTFDDEVTEQFSFKLVLKSSYPIDQFRLPKHPNAIVSNVSPYEWVVEMGNAVANAEQETPKVGQGGEVFGLQEGVQNEINNVSLESVATSDQQNPTITGVTHKLDTDIVVYWRHQQGLPGRLELLAYKEAGNAKGTFMMTLTPGDDLAAITEGRDWIFVLDYSGSMQGKYQSMVEGVNKGIRQLSSDDRFRIFIFNNRASELTNGFVPATPEQVQQWSARLVNKSPEGSTNLYDGIKLGTEALDADRSSALVLVTDGVANVGVTEKKAFLRLLQAHDVRLFTFVMGNSANRPLLEGMVEVSNGFAISVSNSDDIVGQLMQATSKLTHQALHDVEVAFSGVKVTDLSPARIGSLYRGEQLIVFGHYYGDGPAHVMVTGKISGVEKNYQTSFDFPVQNELNPELERLWAFAAIEDLQRQMDYFGHNADTEQAITDIAIDHGLVTNYTSLLVMSEEQFSHHKIDRSNKERVVKEQVARQQRQAEPIRTHRVDSHQPISHHKAPSHSGSGTMGFWSVLLVILLMMSKLGRQHLVLATKRH